MINVLINGANGKMGQTTINAIKENENFSVVYEFDKNSSIEEIKKIPDVIIDFSIPDATFNILKFARLLFCKFFIP
jgi:dihydrodipicolinate reductase